MAALLLSASGPANAANINWGLDADGFWDLADNWVGGVLPGASDVAFIDVGGSVVRTITHRTGTTTIAGIQNEEFVDVTTGSTLSLSSTRGCVNLGTLQAHNGTLNLEGINLANAGGTLSAINGGRINLSNGVDIVGGTLSTSSSGAIMVAVGTGAYFYDVTLTSGTQFIASNASMTFLHGTITNNGTITLSSLGNATDLILATATTTFAGTGVVSMGNNINNRILGSGTQSLSNSAGHTIQGAGQIGVNLLAITNAGTIAANQPAGMEINPNVTGLINTGTLRATNNATLQLTGANGGSFTNTGGTIEAQDGSTVRLIDNAIILGGTLTTTGTGVITTPSGGAVQMSATLDGVTISSGSKFVGAPNSQTTLIGTITNAGTMELAASAAGVADFVVSGDVTLTGTGVVSLTNNAGNRIRGSAASRLINEAGHTIRGAGYIGADAIAITIE